jgi:galactokinase
MTHDRDSATAGLCSAFQACYARSPRWLASAPGRVNLIGEFTDFNDGFVLPMALSRRTSIVAAPNHSDHIVVRSDAAGATVTLTIGLQPAATAGAASASWTNYPKGVLAGYLAAGLHPSGFDALITSEVPMGAGLSSSAALAVSFATLLEAACGAQLDLLAKALLCQRAEQTYAGVPCGIMDPYVATAARAGHVLLLDCRSLESTWLPFADPDVSVLVINTGVRHELAASQYSLRRRECVAAAAALGVTMLREASMETLAERAADMDPLSFRRARHVISENARTLWAAECVRQRDWGQLGGLMDESHESLRTDFAVSCLELDAVVDIAHAIGRHGGVFGCRMTGGGFGGCAVALVERGRQEAVAQQLGRAYRARTGIETTPFVSQPGRGARLDEV